MSNLDYEIRALVLYLDETDKREDEIIKIADKITSSYLSDYKLMIRFNHLELIYKYKEKYKIYEIIKEIREALYGK